MKSVQSALHFFNVFFIFSSGLVFFNMMLLNQHGWWFIIFYLIIILMNVFICFAVLNVKYDCIRKLMDVYRRNAGGNEAKHIALENFIHESIQLNDLIEYTLGPFARYLADISLFLSIFITGVSGISVAGIYVDLLLLNLNRTHFLPVASNNTSIASGMLAKENSTNHPFHHFDNYNTHSYLYFTAAGLIPIALAVAMTRKFSVFGVTSLIGIVCVAMGTVTILKFTRDPISYEESQSFTGDRGDAMFIFANVSMQFAAWILPIENCMGRYRRVFRWFLILSAGVTAAVVVVIGVCLIYTPSSTKFSPVVVYLSSALPMRLFYLFGMMMYYLPLTFPCITMLESRLFRRRKPRSINQSIQMEDFFGENNKSVFYRIRLNENITLTEKEIRNSLAEDFPKKRYILRVLFVITQWILAFLCILWPVIILILILVEFCGTLFIGYALPAAQLFSNKVSDVGRLTKLGSVLITAFAMTMTVLGYYFDINFYNKFIRHS